MKLTFLSAAVPLTKTITFKDGVIHKDSYPLQSKFTSTNVEVKTLLDMYKAIKTASQHPAKPCLLKGIPLREISNESRKGLTRTNTSTQWMCHDLDRAQFNSPDEYMRAVGLGDVSYVVQYSSSHKLNKRDKTLSCHIFCLLSEPRPAPELKAWLMHLNLTVEALKNSLTLSNSQIALHWPLDITCCQNDKLIYVAEPTFVGMKSPISIDERIQLVKRDLNEIPVERIALRPMDALKKDQRTILNNLQVAAGITPTKAKTKMVGEYEVQLGVGEIAQYSTIDCDEYVRINLNGGDSRAYYHRKDDLTYLHNFKGEPSVLLKEILPQYYADLVRERSAANATPNEGGEILLAYRDKVTADYWKGTWHPESRKLEIYRVKTKDQLQDFLMGHGHSLGEFVPEWHTVFDPQNPVVVDEENHVVNRFAPSRFMYEEGQVPGDFPAIQRLLDSAVGTGEIQDHFLNWLACIFQFRVKTRTAWILHGTYGTGKGMLVHDVITPLLSASNTHRMRAATLNEDFNGYIENALLVFVDEIDADMFTNAKKVNSDLKNWITEPTATIRRMRTDQYEVNSFVNFIFASNEKQPVYVPIGDRRYNVGHFQSQRFFPTQEEIDAIPGELKHFAHFLQNYDADLKRAGDVLQTAERAAIQQLGVTSIDRLASNLLQGDLSGLLEALPDVNLMDAMGMQNPTAAAYVQLIKRFTSEKLSRITRDELAVLFSHCVGKIPEGAHKFTAFLRHHGIVTKVMRIDGATLRGIEVEWQVTDDDRAIIKTTFQPRNTKLKAVK